MLRFVTFLSFVIAFSNASLFCPHTKMPSDLKSFETLRIQSKKAVGQEPMYRLANIEDTDKSFTISSPKFRLITRTDNVECPSKGCITELSAAQPKSQSSILYLTNIIGKMIPPGFQHVESSIRLYCVIVAGDCGATVPIYRYYKFLPNGLYHAYSTNEDIEIQGYVREPQPLCFGWKTLSTEQLRAEGIEGSGEEEEEETDISSEEKITDEEREEGKKEEFKMMPEMCDDKTPPKPSSMKALNVYVNDKTGALKDHYYTTKIASAEDQKNSESEFFGYKLDEKISNIGMVVVDEEKSKCGCLIRLSQMLDEQTGMFTRKDHKLAADFKEPPPSGGEKYVALDEEVFCVREQGACGANVALRKYLNILELDTVYTVNKTDIPPLTVPSPPGVLCYIWPYQKPHKKDPKKEEIVKKNKTSEKPTTSAPKTTPTISSTPTTKVTSKKATTPISTIAKSSTTTVTPKTTDKVKVTPAPTTTPSTTVPSTTTEQSSTQKSTVAVVESTTTVSQNTVSTKETTVETKTTQKDSKKEETTAETKTTTSAPKTEETKATKKP